MHPVENTNKRLAQLERRIVASEIKSRELARQFAIIKIEQRASERAGRCNTFTQLRKVATELRRLQTSISIALSEARNGRQTN